MFLPDRFIKGECPKCDAKDQYGDTCEACGATYSPTELNNPVSAVSGATPVHKESEHYFFKLGGHAKTFCASGPTGHLQAEAANKMQEWFASGLQQLGHLPRRALLRLRNSRCAGQVFLCLAGCAGRLHGQLQEPVRKKTAWISTPSGNRIPKPSCSISSARTSCISTPCSGRPC